MKVAIVTNIPYPNGMAAANRISCYAEALLLGGAECEVIAYRRTERYGVTPKNTAGRGLAGNVPFRYVSGTPLRGSNAIKRKLGDLKDKTQLLRYVWRELHRGDALLLYIFSDPLYATLLCLLSRIREIKCTGDLCEIPYGTTTASMRNKMGRFIETRFLLPLLDGLIPISEELSVYASKYVSKRCRIQKIPILVDFEKYNLEERSHEADVPYIFHSGTLTEQKDGILGMVEAFGLAVAELSSPVKMVCTGRMEDAREAEQLRALINKYGLEDKIVFTGFLSNDELTDYLSKASIVIINKYRTEQNRYCFSTKLGEYMAAGKAIVITAVGEAMNWLEDGKDCLVVEPGDSSCLSAAVVRLFNESDLRIRISENAKYECRKFFDFRAWSDLFVSFYKSL